MNLSLFDYDFPKELVAQHPLPRREDSRLMVLHRKDQKWEHRQFSHLLDHLREGDLMVFNNALADLVPAGDRLVPALPPYIKRKKPEDFTEEDFQRYRTIYGQVPGSKAAPTAGFHFSEEILTKIRSLGIETAFVTLHVSYDTYKPIRLQNVLDHPMHGEEYVIPEETAEKVIRAKKENRRVIAVGTTTIRVLESWGHDNDVDVEFPSDSCGTPRSIGLQGQPRGSSYSADTRKVSQWLRQTGPRSLQETSHRRLTKLYITPGFPFQIVDVLLTNFHRPRSTVLVMVSAFVGRELILSAYEDAIRQKYRLFSYGDAMLIL